METLPRDSVLPTNNMYTTSGEGAGRNGSESEFLDVLNKIKSNLAVSGEPLGSFIAEADTSDDGKLDSEELAAALDIPEQLSREFIARFDSPDGDGALDESELADALEENAETLELSKKQTDGDKGFSGSQIDLLELLLKLLDKDGDGKVSQEEFQEFAINYGNGNGKLTDNELVYGLLTEAKAQGLDFTSEEISALVERIDANGDGVIRRSEIESILDTVELKAETTPVPHEPEPEPKSPDEEPPRVEVGPDVLPWQALINLVDADGDGKVSKEELTLFELKHGNGDGWLTKDELKDGLRAEAEEYGLSVTEADIEQAVNIVDADENKVLTAAELTVPLSEQSLLNSALTQ